jgi:hypothetical protein
MITSPIPDPDEGSAVFYENQSIPVTVEASTTKGSIKQVVIYVDDDVIDSKLSPPYNFTIAEWTIQPGLHALTAVAYSSEGNSEVAEIYITIKETK